ncbi:MAG: hypothetical protein A2270_01425 [Elusimicrobia bacterium RIFOXYA12_FULL_51_18]|nr:MAG: hypothetical protein A2270_01425 [Elusimicrobia bacterium RIFOXYA12_FULL_51_18]OGS30012.1 MAG: hypothetical protein A2218_12720 [Elusimicrobia bacterium RIFOXYA2_FULL_53_38]
MGLAWVFHITESPHNAADDDCQICAVFCSPELNSDGGTLRLTHPDNSSRINFADTAPFVKRIAVFICSSRAPPFSA